MVLAAMRGRRGSGRQSMRLGALLVVIAVAAVNYHTASATNPHEVTACATGKFHENGGCTDCPAGRWQEPDNHWLTKCKECPAGRYSSSGASACTDCAVGMYTNQNHQASCRDCGVGFFQDRTRSYSCKHCVPGQFTDQVKQSTCKICGVGKYS